MSNYASYGRLDHRFWIDEKVRVLPPLSKLVASYLISGPQQTFHGLCYVSPGLAAEHLGMPPEVFRSTMLLVCEHLGWRYDQRTSVLWIPTWWKRKPLPNHKQVIGMVRSAQDIPFSNLVREWAEFMASIIPENQRDLFGEFLQACPTNDAADTLSDRVPDRVSDRVPDRDTPTYAVQEQEQEQVQVQEQEQVHSKERARARKDRQKRRRELFEAFWLVVHRKVAKAAAERAFYKALDRETGSDGDVAAMITKAMDAFRDTPNANPTDRSPIHPATWLNQGRYHDDQTAWQDGGPNEHQPKIQF